MGKKTGVIHPTIYIIRSFNSIYMQKTFNFLKINYFKKANLQRVEPFLFYIKNIYI